MKRAIEIAKLAALVAAVVLLVALAWCSREVGKFVIAAKGETHATAAQAKSDEHMLAMDAHQLAMIGGIRASQSGELIAAYSKAGNSLNDAAVKLGAASSHAGGAFKSIDDYLNSPDGNATFQNLTVATRSSVDLIREARSATGESVTTQKKFQDTLDAGKAFLAGPLTNSSDSATRLLTPMGLFVSDMQFKEHQFFFGKGCPVGKQDCPKEKLTFWQRSLQVINAARGYTQPGYYGYRMVTGQ